MQADEPDAENKCDKAKNEKVDKRKLIDEVAGMMKSAGCSDEIIRTAIKDMEKESYDESEAGTVDNKKDEKADNKCAKNSMEETLKDFYQEVKRTPSDYISESKAREIGKQRY